MSKRDLLYVKGMNISESDSDSELEMEDIWDDSKLNNAYNRALQVANAEVAQRVAMSTNSQSNSDLKTNKQKPRKSQESNEVLQDWKPGMSCRAIYDEDGEEYEALVLRLVGDNECVVKYLGYDNTEMKQLVSLKPSKGEDERLQQIQRALDEQADDTTEDQPMPPVNINKAWIPCQPSTDSQNRTPRQKKKQKVSFKMANGKSEDLMCPIDTNNATDKPKQKKKKSKKSSKNSPIQIKNGYPVPDIPFPMPNLDALKTLGGLPTIPPPPASLQPPRVDSDEQDVSNMLISWYMSGYYTGLYQGLKRAQENNRKP